LELWAKHLVLALVINSLVKTETSGDDAHLEAINRSPVGGVSVNSSLAHKIYGIRYV